MFYFPLDSTPWGVLYIADLNEQVTIQVQPAIFYFKTFTTFLPAAPLTPPPPWTPLPQRYKLSIGVLWLDQPGMGRMNMNWSSIS